MMKTSQNQQFGLIACFLYLVVVLAIFTPIVATGEQSSSSAGKKVLILDYTLDNIQADIIKSWIPVSAVITSIHITAANQLTDELLHAGYTHVIHSGSELMLPEISSTARENAKAIVNGFKDAGVPQFGICFGHQLLGATLMGVDTVAPSPNGREIGWKIVEITEEAQQMFNLNPKEVFFQLHRDEVSRVPEGAVLLATNEHSPVQGFIHSDYKMLSTQFHPEMTRVTGNEIFTEYKAFIKSKGMDFDEVITGSPSEDASRKIFDVFLSW